jgi:hypothetical protein
MITPIYMMIFDSTINKPSVFKAKHIFDGRIGGKSSAGPVDLLLVCRNWTGDLRHMPEY